MREETSRLSKILDALTQLGNVSFLPDHKSTNANESISGRSYRQGWKLRHVIDALFFWQKSHCEKSHYKDLERAKDLLKIQGKP